MNGPLVIITSKGHVPRMRAHRILLENQYTNWKFVVDNVLQAASAIGAGVPASLVIVTHRPTDIPAQDGIAWTRQWIERNVVPREHWYVSLDDNVGGWTYLPKPHYDSTAIDFEWDKAPEGHTWRELFNTPMPFHAVVDAWYELIRECDAAGTQAGGFAIETNYYFRGRKWQRLGYVRAQNAVWKNMGLPFYYWPGAMLEDFVRTVDVVSRCSSVCINRFVKPQKQFFEAGGIGSFEERLPNLAACCAELLRRYPGLLRHNKGQDYSLTFVPKSTKGVDVWRLTGGK